MIKCILLVPVLDNSGRPFRRMDWRDLERRLVETFGGFSRESGVIGEWLHGDRVYKDRSRRYTVSFGSWQQLPAWLEIVAWARSRFRQEALYIEIAGVPEIL